MVFVLKLVNPPANTSIINNNPKPTLQNSLGPPLMHGMITIL